jgi:DNA-directed RNA polymerase subunit RPC12/RpoP
MARNKAIEERVKTLVAELLAEEKSEGQPKNINDIEDAMVRIGDMVAREFGMQSLAAHTSQMPRDPQCPDCGHAGEHLGEQTRDLITRRGEVPLTEAKYRCPKCRRLFFPSDCSART